MTVPFSEPHDRIGHPHDRLFRAIVENARRAQDLIETHVGSHFPGLLAPVPPVALDGTFVDENLRMSQVDKLFAVQLRDGAPAFVHVLLEHKSTSDPAIALQLARYKSRIWEAYADGKLSVHWPGGAGGPSGSTTRVDRLWALPAIIPVVFYHGGDPWTAPFSIAEMILHKELGEFESRFGYVLRNLGELVDRELAGDPATRAGLIALRYSHRGTAEQRREALPGVLADLPDGTRYEKQVIVYLMGVWSVSRQTLAQAAERVKPGRGESRVGEVVQELIDQGMAEGLKQGMAQGMEQGKVQERVQILTRLLEHRFGPVPPGIRQRIRTATPEELDAKLSTAFDAMSLPEVFGDIDPE